jgi:phage terminase large subunit-like protein
VSGEIDYPEGFENWPQAIRSKWLADYHALYFPKLRWWDKPETDEEDSGPRPKQLPPDHPRHGDADRRGYRCGCGHRIPDCPDCPPCPGNPDWSVWLMLTARGCVGGWTRVWLPLEDRYERIDRLAEAGKPVTILALAQDGPRLASTDGAPFLKGKDALYEVTTRNGLTIHVTDQHRFLTPDGWRRLAELGTGDKIAAGAPHGVDYMPVVSIEPSGICDFYDMTVPGPQNYAAEGFWNHNTGKTKAGSNWVLEMALSKPGLYVGLCAPTHDDIRSVCIEGDSGLLAEARRNSVDIPEKSYNKNRQEIELPNGSRIRGFSAEKPESIRGENLSYVWFDELAMIRYFSFYHEGLQPALRKGENPRLMITTTPKRVRLIRDLIEESRFEFTGEDGGEGTGVHLTEAISAENIHFSRKQRLRLERKYAGNPVMLAQELRGEMLGEVDGALFPIDKFNETRVFPDKDALPQWRRVVVAIDPATTSRESSDETGIVIAAEGEDGDFYCLEDCSGKFPPDQQMKVVAEAFHRRDADCVVGEVNMTGDYMRSLLNTVDANIPLRSVHGMRGKVSRAQGPSSLFMQGRIHMVGDHFAKLEDQLAAMAEGDDRSRMKDDRADAFVWAMIHLSGAGQGDWGLVYGFRDCVKCGARVNEDKDRRCANCGAEVAPAPPKHPGGRPAREPWSAAYLNTCASEKCGKTYPRHERTCPHCSPSPESYMRRVMALSAGGGGWIGYSGKDILRGRRF